MKEKIFARINLLTILAACLLFLFIPSQQVKAEEIQLQANQWYNLELDGGTMQEYTFVMPKQGYFYFQVTPEYYTYNGEVSDSTSWWMPTKMTVNYKQYVDTNCHYGNTWKSEKYAFKKGTKVKLKFTSTSDSAYQWYYKVRIVTKDVKNFETESNNSKSSADKIKKGKVYAGLIMNEDTDWYVFTAPADGKYKVKAVNTDTDRNSYFNAQLYKDYTLSASDTFSAGTGWKSLKTLKLKKGQKIYLKMDYSYHSNVYYKFKIDAVK